MCINCERETPQRIDRPTSTSHARMSLSTSTLSKTNPHLIFPHPSKHDRLQILTANLNFLVVFCRFRCFVVEK